MAQIKTYARLKPTKKPFSGYEISKSVLTVHIPDSKDFLVVGSQQSLRSNLSYDIMFTDIFRPEATQEDVFDGVAKGIIQSFLNGYNGTIFAYGQTGTGKTYTVEGNTTRYSTRGLSTRALSMIYQQLENRMDDHITVCLSYLEIYQEVAYDLLNPISRSSLPMAPFAKVTVVEGPRGSCIFRGLSLHLAANEEIAQMLLLQGQANRKVAETPVNQRSSRSHAVFTVYLQMRKHDSDVLLNSKLHLVDLAGSERVSKTGVDGQQLTEAKSINLSLHHLETVIIALQTDRSTSSSCTGGGEKSKGDYPASQSRSNTSFLSGPSSDSGTKPYKYVPYRNSLLTMVLKDSLGGNCLTAMIATISMELENLGESISTCRFAQRVARIANNARRNEEVDDKTVIKRLRHKVANLEHQLTLLRSKGRNDSLITDDDILNALSEDDRTACAKIMEGFLQGAIADPVHAGIYDQSRFRECLHLLKHQYLNSVTSSTQFLTPQQLQLQSRQVVADLPSEIPHQLQPNNPHRDSGDHAISEATQADSSIFISQQRPPFCCSSLLSMQTPEYFLVNEDQVIGTVSTTSETEKQIAENKGSQIEKLLEFCAAKKHCAQYDRQKGKELKKPNQKLTSLEHEQAVKQEQLALMSQDILMQELLGAENNLRLKLQAVEEQVIQQHAYLMQLKHNQSDAVQVAREQLVEQHLLKRRVKFHDKLSKLLENKAKLQCALSPDRDMSSSVCAGSSRMSMDNTFGQLKHGKGCQTCFILDEKDQQTELIPKFDKEKFALKPKQPDINESISPEKIRELKQRLRISQLQADTLFGISSARCQNASDKHQVQISNSVDSNRSLRGNECIYSFVKSNLERGVAADNEFKYDQTKMYPMMLSSRTGLHSKDKSCSEISRTIDQQTNHLQEYLTSGYKERADDDTRQVKGGGIIRPESTKKLENGVTYMLRNSISPYQQGLNSSVLVRQGNMIDIPIQTSDALIESPTLNGSRPIEVRSFHDPHHSHKFALDDMPAECSLISNSKTGTIDGLNNKNNSYIPFVHCLSSQNLHCFNYNSNAITDTVESFDKDEEGENKSQVYEHQNRPPSPLNSSMTSSRSSTSCNIPASFVCDSDKAFTKELVVLGHNHNVTDPKSSNEEVNLTNDIAEAVSENYEELTKSLKQHNILPNNTTHHSLHNQLADASPQSLICGDDKKSESSQDSFETCGFPPQKHDSTQSHVLELEKDVYEASLPAEVSPCKKCSFISSTQHKSGDHHMTSPQKSRLKMCWKRKFNMMSDLRSDMKLVTDTKSVWSPSIENASAAGGQNGLLYTPSVFLSFGDQIYGDNSEWKKYTSLYSQNELDSFDMKLAKYRWDKQMEDDDDDEEEYDENLSQNYSFFYLHPAEVKLSALTSEERERTYMLTVAAEKTRVMQIRKARKAAQIIQRCWRAYKANG